MVVAPEDWLTFCLGNHDRELLKLRDLDAYYEGRQPLSYMTPELLLELGDRLRAVVINWPRLVVDSRDERLEVAGFRVSGAAKADERLWETWQVNDLDDGAQQAHVDAMVMRRSYVIVGADENDPDHPLITIESPLEVHAEWDPRTRQLEAVTKRWAENPPGGSQVEHATLYLPDRTIWFVKESRGWQRDPDIPEDVHGLGVPPVVVLPNRPRIRAPLGMSELDDVIPLSDAACKVATDMMVSAEFHAMPRRWALGFGPEDFTDANGNPVPTWSKIAGRIWASEKTTADGAQVGQFPEAQLSNFHETLNQLAKLVGSLTGLPPDAVGFTGDNPASADAIRAREARLVKLVERKQRTFGAGWERVMRLADRIVTGKWNADLRRLETLWRDASTPTVAQSADAAVKKLQAGIVPLRQTREDLGYTQEQIALMEEEDAKQAEADAAAFKLAPAPAAIGGPAGEQPGPSQMPDLTGGNLAPDMMGAGAAA